MSKGQTLQDPFLNALRKDRIPVSIFLVNGIKLQGQIESFDQYVVLLKNTVSQMVYKHAISTIVPMRNPRTGAEIGGVSTTTATTNYPMASSSFERTGSYETGMHTGYTQTHRQGGFTRTTPNQNFGGSYERQSSYPSSQGYERSGFENRGFGNFDRSSYEERGFDGKNFDGNSKKIFDSKAFESKGFDKDFDTDK